MKLNKQKLITLALGLGMGLSSLINGAAIAGTNTCQSDRECLAQERACYESGAPFGVCDRQLSRCLRSCN